MKSRIFTCITAIAPLDRLRGPRSLSRERAIHVPEEEILLVYEEPPVSISPELDKFDLKYGFF